MPAVRFSRDKRGYEYVYLVHTPVRRGKPGRSRVLYWYRTPPGVRVGRQPFDPDIQKLIEQQNPGVTFDWNVIINTPMPPPDMTEYWRERRRAEKAARQERRQMEAGEASVDAGEGAPADEAPSIGDGVVAADVEASDFSTGESAPTELPPATGPGTGTESDSARKRRRRRGGRRRRTGADGVPETLVGAGASDEQDVAGTTAEGDEPEGPSDPGDPTSEGE